MAKLSKRRRAINEKIVAGKSYAIDDALTLIKELSTVKFPETVDVAINLGIDPRKSDQIVRGATTLPHGSGKQVRVCVFAQGEAAESAKVAGAELVGMDELADEIKSGNMDFDVVIASPDAMRVVGMLGKVLGPRGLMPNPKTGTVTMNVGKAVEEVKAGKIDFKVDKNGIVHVSIGKVSFDSNKIFENANEVIQHIIKIKPSSSKGNYLQSISMSSTMSPGIKVDTNI